RDRNVTGVQTCALPIWVFAVNDGKLMHKDSTQFYIAGAEANTLIGLSKLGVSSQFVSATGNDAVGDAVKYQLKGEGVGTEFLGRSEEHTSELQSRFDIV